MNPYHPPTNLATASTLVSVSEPTLAGSLQTTWIASGCCLLGMLVICTLAFENSFASLLRSDDSYVGAFAVAVPVTVCFALGSAAGWWFRSKQVAWRVSCVCFGSLGSLLWVFDLVHDFGEGDTVVGYFAIGGSI